MDVVDLAGGAGSAVLHTARQPHYGAVLGGSADLADCTSNFRLQYSGMNTDDSLAKRLFREFTVADLREALAAVRASHPGLSVAELVGLLRGSVPSCGKKGKPSKTPRWRPKSGRRHRGGLCARALRISQTWCSGSWRAPRESTPRIRGRTRQSESRRFWWWQSARMMRTTRKQLSDAQKSARIKRLIGEMKRAHPGWSFDRCWTQLRTEQPGLFEEGD
jgi:hypothetical protein